MLVREREIEAYRSRWRHNTRLVEPYSNFACAPFYAGHLVFAKLRGRNLKNELLPAIASAPALSSPFRLGSFASD